jgi:hypothetical protein
MITYNNMTRKERIEIQNKNVDVYIEKALVLFNNGFSTMADKKRCNEMVSRAYDALHDVIMTSVLDKRDNMELTDEGSSVYYWSVPAQISHYNLKKTYAFVELFPETVEIIKYLIELRNEIKNALIVKVESKSKANEEKIERVERSLKEIFEKNMANYKRGLEIAKIFGGLLVHVTPHYVHRDGGRFVRYFYFMAGKLTALNTILACMQTLEDEKEKEN